jgi:hypothetical protein
LENSAAVEKTATGIGVRPCRTLTWDEVFAEKLSIGKQSLAKDLSELSGDDLLFIVKKSNVGLIQCSSLQSH